MRKPLFFGLAAADGALLAYLLDPDRGRSRRSRLSDQASAKARDLTHSMRQTVEYQKGVARGVLHDLTGTLRPEIEYDDETLTQKVRSEALGYWDGSGDIEIDIANGMVRITGTVDGEDDRERLIELINDVDGVSLVDDRLTVA